LFDVFSQTSKDSKRQAAQPTTQPDSKRPKIENQLPSLSVPEPKEKLAVAQTNTQYPPSLPTPETRHGTESTAQHSSASTITEENSAMDVDTTDKQMHEEEPDEEVKQIKNSIVNLAGSRLEEDEGEDFAVWKYQHVSELAKDDNLIHKIMYPPDWPVETDLEERSKPFPPFEMAKSYPFELDPFQKRSIECVERNENVLVAAHTSAGKTTVAEYAIAKSLKEGARVIYTSPIKALSNQKYRELQEEFDDVGLMTGDVTINPQSGCLVMTTEILRNMLYRGSEMIREIAWVIFDEIHYIKDKHRGVVWEECLILLPKRARLVFLSATIPNSIDFAHWIAKLNKHPCHVVYTEFRPTPLQHYIFPAGGTGIHLVVDEKRNFKESNFQKAISELTANATDPAMESGKLKGRASKAAKKKKSRGPPDIFKLIRMVMQRQYDPVIIFAFSKKRVESLAMDMSKLDFCSEDENKLISRIFKSAIDSLSDDDKQLPQVVNILPMLQRGIGIHHSGLLPILKEVVEILFGEGLLKCLFATETFAMGINMPAKTVVFASVTKFDGTAFRLLTSGEYIQMSGRSGRRGIDTRGIVIMMIDKKMEPADCKVMLRGQADPLFSAFVLGYNMLLNLLRVEDANPEYIIRRSLMQFQAALETPKIQAEKQELENDMDGLEIEDEALISEYYLLRKQFNMTSIEFRTIRNQPKYITPFLQVGRLLRIQETEDRDWGWGCCINFKKLSNNEMRLIIDSGETISPIVVDVLLSCKAFASKEEELRTDPVPAAIGEASCWRVIPVQLHHIRELSSIRVSCKKDIRKNAQMNEMGKTIVKAIRKIKEKYGKVPTLDPVVDMRIKDEKLKKLIRKIETLEDRMRNHMVYNTKGLEKQYKLYSKKVELKQKN